MTTTLIIGLLIPLLGTMLGSAFVFFMRDEMSARLQKSLLGFASGVMVAASVWSLILPAMDMETDSGTCILCRRSHVLRSGGGTDTRSVRRPALQPQHYRLCRRLCPYDGPRCGDGVKALQRMSAGNFNHLTGEHSGLCA